MSMDVETIKEKEFLEGVLSAINYIGSLVKRVREKALTLEDLEKELIRLQQGGREMFDVILTYKMCVTLFITEGDP